MRSVFLPYFLKHLQGLERIIEKLVLGRIAENFLRPVANRAAGFQNPLGQFGIIKFQKRVLVEHLPSGAAVGLSEGKRASEVSTCESESSACNVT